jgi:hypothetical protein
METNTEPARPGYSNMVLILDSSLEVVAREKDHLHAKSLALEIGYNLVEECQPERRRWRYIKGCWQRV